MPCSSHPPLLLLPLLLFQNVICSRSSVHDILHFMEPEALFSCSQQSATGWTPS
jgi:hypothetical protein